MPLDSINSPLDVKTHVHPGNWEVLAEEIREELTSVLENRRDTFGPNLGVVELTLAMHSRF